MGIRLSSGNCPRAGIPEIRRRTFALTAALAATAVLIATSMPVRAQEDTRVPSLSERTSQLQRDFRALERGAGQPGGQIGVELTQATGLPAANAAMARIDVRLGGLEDDVRTLTGRVEQLGYEVRQLGDRVDKVVSDLEFRLRRLEEQAGVASDSPSGGPAVGGESPLRQAAPMLGGGLAGTEREAAGAAGAARAGTGPESGPGVLAVVPRSEIDAEAAGLRRAVPQQPVPQQPAPQQPLEQFSGLVGDTPQEQYAYAFGLLRVSQYDQAEQALKAFLAENPDHTLSDNARYWLGETYYVRGQYPEAAQQFVDAYQKNRTGAKSADALLKLGMSLSQLGKSEEACATFRELSRTQPDAPETVRDKAAKEAQRTGCS
jgi:tol-pal system protein YbgF